MKEFLGRSGKGKASAIYIVANDGYSEFTPPTSPSHMPVFLKQGLDVERSLWDREALIADIDLDYQNFDSATAPHLDRQRTLALVEPVFRETTRVLSAIGIEPLNLVSGRGFHLLWRIPRGAEAFERLAGIGRVPTTLSNSYACLGIDLMLAKAFAGLGMVLEFVAHRVLSAAVPQCAVPVQITAIEVGPGGHGREIVSIDLSEYGDPLHQRHVRLPFSGYLKPRKVESEIGEDRVSEMFPLFEIPLADMTLTDALMAQRDPEAVRRLAARTSVEIPDQSIGTLALFERYRNSALSAFHEEFYSVTADQARSWMMEPGDGALNDLPLCAKWILDHPNDWLLKPAALQHLARVLTALRWHPRAIAELIGSRYEIEDSWGDCWTRLDPSWRAIFYTRLFTGLIALGRDSAIDLNCVSHKEKGYCTIPECYGNLMHYRDLLMGETHHE